MEYSSIDAAKTALHQKKISLPELVQSFLEKASSSQPELNAYTAIYPEKALEEAKHIQARIDAGTAGKLAGTVLAIKDVIAEEGKTLTCGSNMLKTFESVYDATVISKLKEADVVFLGRTNMDEFAMGSSNENSHFGAVKNPYDISKVPGGSSGGSAVAVAASTANASLGTDTGGSIRQPASFCGVVGLKPTYGRVSRYGLVAFASSFDGIGPFSKTVKDAACLLETIAGEDANDQTCSSRAVPAFSKGLEDVKRNIKIGVPEEYFGEGLDDEIRAGIEKIIGELGKSGAELVPIHLPHMKHGIATYYILTSAEASSNLARYDGIRYGHRAGIKEVMESIKRDETGLLELLKSSSGEGKESLEKELKNLDSPLIKLYKLSRSQGFGDEVKRRIMLGTYVLSSGYYDAYFAKAQKVRRLIQQDFTEAFQAVDVIVSPTTPTTAFDLGAKIDDPLQMYLNDVYTITANLAGICAISVPAGIHSNGLPYGIQFMGAPFREDTILNAGKLVEGLF